MAAGSERMSRSIKYSTAVDEVLEGLARSEGTSRSWLMREALGMLFADRGIDVDVHDGMVTNRRAVEAKRRPKGDEVRDGFVAWWQDARDGLLASVDDPGLLETVVGLIADHVERNGQVRVLPADVLVPVSAGKQPEPDEFRRRIAVEDSVRVLVAAGGVRWQRVRTDPRGFLQPAPWLVPEPERQVRRA